MQLKLWAKVQIVDTEPVYFSSQMNPTQIPADPGKVTSLCVSVPSQ